MVGVGGGVLDVAGGCIEIQKLGCLLLGNGVVRRCGTE